MTKDFGDPSIRLGGALECLHDGYSKAFGGRKCSFHVYDGSGGDYHVLAADDGGGFVVADSIQWREWAMSQPDQTNLIKLAQIRGENPRIISSDMGGMESN